MSETGKLHAVACQPKAESDALWYKDIEIYVIWKMHLCRRKADMKKFLFIII